MVENAVSIRAYYDPLLILEQQLRAEGVIWQYGRQSSESVEELLRKACDKLQEQGQTLLLVFDQFEELTIIQDAEIQTCFSAFLQSFCKQPPKNLKMLAVLRSDYLGKVEDLALPPIRQQENWQEISPFDYAAAQQFFEDSGLDLSPELLGKVLLEAGEIEENPGLLRPITLNILGMVLQRFGGGLLKGAMPGSLIRGYLKESVTEVEVRDFAPMLLRQMVSDAGTKIPLSETELNAKTQLDKGTIRGCLVRLGNRGLVREVDEKQRVWEVAHDFIARLLGQLVAGLLPSWWRKFRPVFTWSVLVLWFVMLIIAYPKYQEWEYGQGRALLANAEIRYVPQNNNPDFFEVTIESKDFEKIPDDIWHVLEKNSKEIVSLEIHSNINLTQLSSLDKLTSLETLYITKNSSLKQLPALDNLISLQTLYIATNGDLKQLRALDKLIALRWLVIDRSDGLIQLPALDKLVHLQKLSISDNNNLTELPSLEGLTSLQSLQIIYNDNLTKLSSLDNLSTLQSLKITNNENLTKLPNLDNLTSLQSLQIINNENLSELPALDKLPNLIVLQITQDQNLDSLQLHKLASLKKLFLSNNDASKTFAESLKQQRQQQGLNTIEIEFTYDYVTLEDEAEKLNQP